MERTSFSHLTPEQQTELLVLLTELANLALIDDVWDNPVCSFLCCHAHGDAYAPDGGASITEHTADCPTQRARVLLAQLFPTTP